MKNNGELISVVVPIYNVELYLERCINSILSQTYSNLEVILVNDGSKDSCGEICKSAAKRDSRIRVINQKNQGLSAARNAGIKVAKGEYILFIDSDDWIEPDLCASTLNDALLSEADVVVYGYYVIDEKYNINDSVYPMVSEKISGEEALVQLALNNIDNYAWNKLYKRSLFEDVIYPVGYLWEDIGTTYKIFERAESVFLSNRVLYYYYKRATNITSNLSTKALQHIFELRYIRYKDLKETYPQISQMLFSEVVTSAFAFYRWGICENYNSQKLDEVKKFLHDYQNSILHGDYFKSGKLHKLYFKFNAVYNLLHKIKFKLRFLKQYFRIVKCIAKPYIRPIKNKFKHFFLKKDEHLLDEYKGKLKCFLIGTPDHDNLGDHAIAEESHKYLNSILSGYEVIEISEEKYWVLVASISSILEPQDIIVLQGGGNISDQYMYIEEVRRDAVKRFGRGKIILFPQTIHFRDNKKGRRESRRTQRIYKKSNTIMIAREKFSFSIMENMFDTLEVKLLPDIVLKSDYAPILQKRDGILLCMRRDKEVFISYDQLQLIKRVCLNICNNVTCTDTCIKKRCDQNTRHNELKKKFLQFSSSRLVVTDRLHGMIFAALTKTPCIVVPNSNYKIKGIYEWLKGLNYISFLEDMDCFEDEVLRLMALKEFDEYPKDMINREFSWLDNKLSQMRGRETDG